MAAPDIFNYQRNPKPAGVLTTEDSILVIGGNDAANQAYLVQQWQINYAQQVQELYELGSSKIYWKKGRPVGQGSIARIAGGKQASAAVNGGLFPQAAFDACLGGATMMLKVGGGSCTGTAALTFEIQGVLVQQLGYSSEAMDAQVNEQVAFRFSYLAIR